jgi:hypothetical protein
MGRFVNLHHANEGVIAREKGNDHVDDQTWRRHCAGYLV